jgi:hypothetical protein
VSKGVFELLLERVKKFQERSDGVSLEMVPSLSGEDDLSLKGLQRVMREYTDLPRHSALRMGEVLPPRAGKYASVSVQVLKPCKKGLPLSTVRFSGRTVGEAAHEAKKFVESILPCEDPDEA